MGPSISASALKKLLAYSFTSFLLVACGGSGGGSSHPADEQAPIQEDKTPDSFTFSALTDVARDVQLVSEIVTISGINTEIAVSISGGEYSIDGGEFTSTAGTIDNNQSLQLRTQTPLEFAQNKTVIVTLDSLHVSFSIETPDAPRMVSLELMPESAIKAGKNLVVSAICDHCDSSKTRYEWRAGGIDAIFQLKTITKYRQSML